MKPYPRYKDSGVKWIGEVPEGWEVKKLKYCFSFHTGWTPPTTNSDYFIGDNTWITIADMKAKYLDDSVQKLSDEALNELRIKITKEGSLLYSFKLSVGKIAFARKDLYTNEAILSISPMEKHNLQYYYYALPECLIINANENIYGAKILNQDLIKNSFLIVPPKPVQKSIAAYLDHKTTQIDNLISKKQELIELLKEERAATINQAVTKGLNPDAPMKDSGIEWLGEVPEKWDVKRLKFVSDFKSGNGITANLIKNDGEYAVYGGNGLRGYTSSYTHEGAYVFIGRQGALCGNINYADGKFWASEHAVVATLISDYNLFWFGELLRTMNLNQYSQSAAQPGLSVDHIKNFFIPVPSPNEQDVIAAYLDRKTTKIDQTTSKINKQINLLKEYRTALISEVVTGKIDVRT